MYEQGGGLQGVANVGILPRSVSPPWAVGASTTMRVVALPTAVSSVSEMQREKQIGSRLYPPEIGTDVAHGQA